MSIANEITRIIGGKDDIKQYAFNGFGIVIPDSVTVDNYKYYLENSDYLAFYCDEVGTIYWKTRTGAGTTVARTIQYSRDFGATWTSITATAAGAAISVQQGEILWFKGNETSYAFNCFSSTGAFHAYGDISSLINFNKTTIPSVDCFRELFRDCSTLYTYENKRIILPATTLTESCYRFMFSDCTHMTDAPDLPATTLQPHCYNSMFRATSVKQSPELPATSLPDGCYIQLFLNDTAIVNAPAIPATTAGSQSCQNMFKGCTSLKTVPPSLPSSVAYRSFYCMFTGCTALISARITLPAMTMAEGCYEGMFEYCSNLLDTPDLPATTLATRCYYAMFCGCTNLKTAPVLPATTLVSQCYGDMFE